MALPEVMKIVDAPAPGGPDALVVLERPLPACGDEDVLIKVAAAGLNRADILQRRGLYKVPAGAPPNPGLEVSGTVVAVGPRVTEFKIGDAVCALLQGGGYSEYCAVNVGQVLPIPGALGMIEAAALPEVYFTVWSNVFEFARLQAGERLLVHGGSSGIGTAAIQLAVARGSTVYTTAGSDEKCRFCERLGATRAINYKSEDFVAAIADATGKQGVNVVLDMVGGSYLSRNLQVLAPEGRLVIIATPGGTKGELDIARVMQNRIFVTGSTLRPRSVDFKREIKARLLEHVWPLLASGRIKPIVDKVFPLSEAGQAQAYMESSLHKGKIVLAVADASA
jgi:NADPH2:quinone reductase